MYEEGLAAVATVRDFGLIFDALRYVLPVLPLLYLATAAVLVALGSLVADQVTVTNTVTATPAAQGLQPFEIS